MTDITSTLKYFARLFAFPPDKEIIHVLRREEFLQILNGSCSEEEFKQLQKLFSIDEQELLEVLQIEYSRLFSVPGENYVAPYESYYRDTWNIPSAGVFEKLLYGDSAVSVKKLYAQEGFKVNPDFGNLPDHISIELYFFCALLQKGKQAETNGNFAITDACREKSNQFLKQHLLLFTETFSENVKRKAALPVYSVLAEMLLNILRSFKDSSVQGETAEKL